MSWSQHLRSAQDFMTVGDTVEAVILTLDREERKMSLGIKQLMPDPWSAIEAKYAVNTRHKAKVRNFTNFGVFVELEEGVDGLIHISDLSWQKKIKHPSEFCKAGVVALPYGVEGICPSKHLRKEDGTNAKVEETLDFKVIEFNKEAKKIVVSHTRTFEEGIDEKPTKSSSSTGNKKATGGNNAGSATSQAVKAINQGNEKSTLGDLDALAALKEKMEGGE